MGIVLHCGLPPNASEWEQWWQDEIASADRNEMESLLLSLPAANRTRCKNNSTLSIVVRLSFRNSPATPVAYSEEEEEEDETFINCLWDTSTPLRDESKTNLFNSFHQSQIYRTILLADIGLWLLACSSVIKNSNRDRAIAQMSIFNDI